MVSTLVTFDGGTPGNTVVAGQNGIDSIAAGSQSYIAGFHGAAAVRAGSPSNTVDTRFRVALGLSGGHYGSIYLKNDTAHGSGSSSVNFFQIVSSSNEVMVWLRARPGNAFSIRTTGGVELRTGTAGELPVGAWFRLDWSFHVTTFDWRIFYTPEGTTPDLSGTVNTTATNQPADKLVLGADSSAAIPKDWSFDTVRFNDGASWYGPYSTGTPPPTGPTAKLWTGSAEVAVSSVTLWTGSAEVPISSLAIS